MPFTVHILFSYTKSRYLSYKYRVLYTYSTMMAAHVYPRNLQPIQCVSKSRVPRSTSSFLYSSKGTSASTRFSITICLALTANVIELSVGTSAWTSRPRLIK